LARVSNTMVGISVPAVSEVRSLNGFFEMARQKPGELNWAGVTGSNSFLFEGFLRASKLDIKKVPYRNPVEPANDLAENRVQFYERAVASAQPQVGAGRARILAMLNSVRAPIYPDIPTVAEAGHPALTTDGLVGLFGAPTMPPELRERIAADVVAVMQDDPV